MSVDHSADIKTERRASAATLLGIEEQLAAGTERMDAFDATLKANTELIGAVAKQIQEVLDIMSTAKAGFRALGWLGAGVRWVGSVVAACAAVWAFYQMLRNGGPPPPSP